MKLKETTKKYDNLKKMPQVCEWCHKLPTHVIIIANVFLLSDSARHISIHHKFTNLVTIAKE